jgi:hypothetical protein
MGKNFFEFFISPSKKHAGDFTAEPPKRLVSAAEVLELALKNGILKSPYDPKNIPELISPLYDGRDYAIEGMSQLDRKYVETYIHHACGYLFAKTFEAVVHWGRSLDGKISIYFHNGDLVNEKVYAELEESLRSQVETKRDLG